MKKFLSVLAVVSFVLLVGMGMASANTVDLNYASTVPHTGTTYATVTWDVTTVTNLDNTKSNTATFDVSGVGGNLFRDFFFNVNPKDVTITKSQITNITTTGYDKFGNLETLSGAATGYNATVDPDSIAADGMGKYDVSISKQGTHNILDMTFSITGLGLGVTADDFFQLSYSNDPKGPGNGYGHFAIQILPGGSTNGTTFFVRDGDQTKKVPEPGMLMLFGSGLVGLGLFGRKKFGK